MQVNDNTHNRKSLVILAVICAVLELAVAPNFGLGNGRANFALVFSAVIALTQGGRNGVIAGFSAGLFFDLCTTGPIGLMAFELTCAGYWLGLGARNRLSEDRGGSFRSFAIASAAVSVIYSVMMLVVGQSTSLLDSLFLRALPTFLLTLVCFVPFLFLVGGSSSGPSFSPGGRGSVLPGRHRSKHLDTKGL